MDHISLAAGPNRLTAEREPVLVFARRELVPDDLPRSVHALLLEGDWPRDRQQSNAAHRHSLDSEFTAANVWIDETASQLAEQVDQTWRGRFVSSQPGVRAAKVLTANVANLFALKLRYEFVKWLRVIAWFERHPPSADLQLVVDSVSRDAACDGDYARLLAALGEKHGVRVRITRRATSAVTPAATSHSVPPVQESRWRRLAELLCRGLAPQPRARQQAVFAFGQPRILEPLFGEVLRRSQGGVWVRDHFAPRSWLKWRFRGGEQLVLGRRTTVAKHDATGADEPKIDALPAVSCAFRGVDLGFCVAQFLTRQWTANHSSLEDEWTAWLAAFDKQRPACLLLDEDATPRKRLAVLAAQTYHIPTFVVQHGVPRVRFGFAPLAADVFLAWGETSAARMRGWGVPRERIIIAGRADLELPATSTAKATSRDAGPRILLFATTPPRDHRPEPVEFHLTTQAHDDLLRNVLAAVQSSPGATLVIKRHPRCQAAALYRALSAEFPRVRVQLTQTGSPLELAAAADVVLNMASGAGVEAAAAGARVIELVPAGGHPLPDAGRWGAIGVATTQEEITALLQSAWDAARAAAKASANSTPVFVRTGTAAARHCVNEILSRTHAGSGLLRMPRGETQTKSDGIAQEARP